MQQINADSRGSIRENPRSSVAKPTTHGNLFLDYAIEVQIARRIDDGFARICATHEFCKPRIVRLQSVTNDRATLRIDRFVV